MNTHIAAAKQMVKQGSGGRIIGAGSIASYRTAGMCFHPVLFMLDLSVRIITENLAPYGATKFAVRGFTEAAAKEWAQYGIRVNGMFEYGVAWLLFLMIHMKLMALVLSTLQCGTTSIASWPK